MDGHEADELRHEPSGQSTPLPAGHVAGAGQSSNVRTQRPLAQRRWPASLHGALPLTGGHSRPKPWHDTPSPQTA